MLRYYLLLDYIVPVYSDLDVESVWAAGPRRSGSDDKRDLYSEHPSIRAPKTRRLLEAEPGVVLYVSYFNTNIGHYTIGCRSRSQAYQMATVLRSMFSLFCGWQPDDRTGHYFLQELNRLPEPIWDERRMLCELRELNKGIFDDFMLELRGGFHVMHDAYTRVPEFVRRTWGNIDIIEALDHMLESRFLFSGFMAGSYYSSHYSRDRQATPGWEMEKRYFESRYRYETAFLAAFKGIERFFGVNQIRRNNLCAVLETKRSLTIAPEANYTRYYEIFSGHEKHVSYKDLLGHFLDLRNIVAAHGNRSPPEHAKLIEDNIYEIQLFLLELLTKAIYPKVEQIQPAGIPDLD